MQIPRNSSLLATGARALRAGFTLIELLAVILIIGLLVTFVTPKILEVIEQAKVTACQANMREIYKGIQTYQIKHKRIPRESGVRFFATLIASRTWENTEDSVKRLTCPAVDPGALECGDLPMEEWYIDLDLVDGGYSTYAGRNMKEYPLRKFPGSGKEVLIADDNHPEMNHRTTTVVLYADNNVSTIELADLVEQGVLDFEEEHLLVGPDSPVEKLQKLSLD